MQFMTSLVRPASIKMSQPHTHKHSHSVRLHMCPYIFIQRWRNGEYTKLSVSTMDSSQAFKLGRDKMNWANNAGRSFIALPCGAWEPVSEAWKWKCFVWVYASGVLCQDVRLFSLLKDCHCEEYKSACLRSVRLLESPVTTVWCRNSIIWCTRYTRVQGKTRQCEAVWRHE